MPCYLSPVRRTRQDPADDARRPHQVQEVRPELRIAPAASRAKANANALEPIELDGAPEEHEGIAVEGLDVAAWTFIDNSASEFPTLALEIREHATILAEHSEINHKFKPQQPTGPSSTRSSARATRPSRENRPGPPEDVLNDLGRQGWVVKAMSTPHLMD